MNDSNFDVIVLGAGPVGENVADYARQGGLSVAVVEANLVGGDLVQRGLRSGGVDVHLCAEVAKVARDGETSSVTVDLDNGRRVVADQVLVATGRRPNTDDLDLEPVGLRSGDPLTTDDAMAVRRVPGSWLFAAGDVTGRAPLTHQGKYEARLLGDRLGAQARGEQPDLTPWGKHSPTADHSAVPQVIFTDPQVAFVGLTAAQAAERGLRTRTVTYDLGSIAGASLHADSYAGTASMVVDVARNVIVGMTFVGQDVAEMLHAATIAVVGELPLDRLWHAVPGFPTISEVWLRLLEEWRKG